MAIRQFPQKSPSVADEPLATPTEGQPVEAADTSVITELMGNVHEDFSLEHEVAHHAAQPNNEIQESRRYPRYLVGWKTALLFPGSKTTILHGIAHELSKGGASVLSEQNIMLQSKTPAVMQLVIPPIQVGEPIKIIDIPCNMVHVYLDSTYQQFRIGIEFTHMDKDTKITLHESLAAHLPAFF